MQDRTAMIFCGAGLCNRIQLVLAAVSECNTANRQMSLAWMPTQHCGAHWTDLFESPRDFTVARVWIAESTHNILDWSGVPAGVEYLRGPTQHVNIRAHYLGDPAPYLHHLDPNFKPIASLSDVVERMRARCTPYTLGVHVRRGDFVTARLKHYRPVESFVSRVTTVLSDLPDGKDCSIFLSTDDGAPADLKDWNDLKTDGVEAAFRKQFGDRIVTYGKRSLLRNSVDAIQDAVIDLWMLRACSAIVGSSTSSFSRIAALGKPFSKV